MRPRIKVLLASGLLLSALVSWPVAAHYRAQARVAGYKRQLQAMGEKLTIAELAPPPSAEGLRGSDALLLAARRTVLLPANSSNLPPTMKYLAPGRALVAWQQAVLPTSDSTNIWPGLADVLAANTDDLADIRAVLQAPVLSFDLDYHQGFNLLLPHLSQLKTISQWLSADAILCLHEGRVTNAWDDLLALAQLAERDKDEPVLISLLVRIAMGSIAINATWEALQAPAGPEEQLQQVQATWESVDLLTQAEAAFAMSRAVEESGLAAWRESYPNLQGGPFATGGGGSGLAELAQLSKDVLNDPKEGIKALAQRYPGYWCWRYWQSYDEELASAETIQAALDAVRKARKDHALAPAREQFDREDTRVQRLYPPAANWLGYSVAFGGQLNRILSRLTCLEIQRSLLVTAIALKRFHLKHGTYPAELSALVPDILREPERDPMDGKPLRYRLNPDGSFLLYSVGDDGVDNGGDPSWVKPRPNAASKRWWDARDAVWPQPASAAEVLAEFKRLRKDWEPPGSPPPGQSRTAALEQLKFYERYRLTPPTNLTTNMPR